MPSDRIISLADDRFFSPVRWHLPLLCVLFGSVRFKIVSVVLLPPLSYSVCWRRQCQLSTVDARARFCGRLRLAFYFGGFGIVSADGERERKRPVFRNGILCIDRVFIFFLLLCIWSVGCCAYSQYIHIDSILHNTSTSTHPNRIFNVKKNESFCVLRLKCSFLLWLLSSSSGPLRRAPQKNL